MLELGLLMAIVNLCKEAIRLERWQTARKKAKEEQRLNRYEAEILHAAAASGSGDGQILLVMINSIQHVHAGGKLFDGDGIAYEQAKYMDGFMSLCGRGLVRHSGGVEPNGSPSPLFLLTGEAFDLDRELHS